MSSQPICFEEAIEKKEWVEAMKNEIAAIEKNDTWELVDFPQDKTRIGFKWIYKTKLNEKGQIEKHKARLVAKGYVQQPNIDYEETFALVARLDTIRTVLTITTKNQWLVYQLDVKSTFLDEEVYVDQPLRSKDKSKRFIN